MIILGVESSCDETSAAVLEKTGDRVIILSNVVASSALLQSKYGGIIPEQAAREQLRSIIPVLKEALELAKVQPGDLDALAVTEGPGLIGSLLIGVETMKVLAKVWNKPLIPVNHLIGHFYANWIDTRRSEDQKTGVSEHELPTFPCLGLLVSGGHTDLVLFTDHSQYEYLGGTRDDAAGECFDKCARILGLPYPGGPQISKFAAEGKDVYKLPRPMLDSKDLDFSFSGLKTAVSNLLKSDLQQKASSAYFPILKSSDLPNLCSSVESAIIEVLVKKTITAAKLKNVDQIIIAGGVAANRKLIEELKLKIENLDLKIKVFVPPPYLCTDNGAMITAAAFFQEPISDSDNIQANPNLSLAY